MATIDLQPIVQPLVEVGVLVIGSLITLYVPKAIAAFQARTGVQLTEQQRATVLGAVQTAAGIIETKIDQGAMQVAHVTVSNQNVADQAQAVLAAVPQATAALGMTAPALSRMIVGAVDTGARTVAAPAAPAAA